MSRKRRCGWYIQRGMPMRDPSWLPIYHTHDPGACADCGHDLAAHTHPIDGLVGSCSVTFAATSILRSGDTATICPCMAYRPVQEG